MGGWIDHRAAKIVTLAGEAEALQRVDSGREKYVRLGAHLKEIRDDATRLDRLEAKAERKA